MTDREIKIIIDDRPCRGLPRMTHELFYPSKLLVDLYATDSGCCDFNTIHYYLNVQMHPLDVIFHKIYCNSSA